MLTSSGSNGVRYSLALDQLPLLVCLLGHYIKKDYGQMGYLPEGFGPWEQGGKWFSAAWS